jgi:hypothetical protein
LSLVFVSKVQLGQDSSGKEETSGVGSGIVVKTNWHTVSLELVRVSSSNDDISFDLSMSNLASDFLIGLKYK